MRKIFKQELADISSNSTIGEITKIVSDEIQFPEPTPFQRVVMETWFSLLSWGLIAGGLLIGIIASVVSGTPIGWIFLILLGGAGVVMIILTAVQKSKYRKIISGCVQGKQELIYKLWFDKNYDDMQVTGGINDASMTELARKYRGGGIPGDARIHAYVPGYQMKGKNGAIIEVAIITWRWTRSNGKSSTTYYRKKVYMATFDFKETFNEFQFTMSKNGIFNKKRTELENEQFNKAWIYNHNDPVKLRMLMTPSVQEDALNFIKNPTFEMSKIGNLFWMSEEISMGNSTFVINTRGSVNYKSKEAVVENLVRDVVSDIEELQKWLINISVFRTLFKTI